MKTSIYTAPMLAIAAILALTPLTIAAADEGATPTYRVLHHMNRIVTPVLDKQTVVLKVQQQGYKNISGFAVEGGAFRLNATNSDGQAVQVFVHPEFGIVLGEEALNA